MAVDFSCILKGILTHCSIQCSFYNLYLIFSLFQELKPYFMLLWGIEFN